MSNGERGSSSSSSSYWCYRCSRFLRVPLTNQDSFSSSSISCPHCYGGFVEHIPDPPSTFSASRRRRFPTAAMFMIGNSSPALRRSRRNGGDRSPFNPVIVLRGPNDGNNITNNSNSGLELYYDDGVGSELRPLPASMSEFLLGSGFERLLDQLSQIEVNGLGRVDHHHPPASKAAIDSMPTIHIDPTHVVTESHCAVCKDPFELAAQVKEMPCKHIYHSDCILPWLEIRNSCPVCRHELPSEGVNSADRSTVEANRGQIENNDEEAIGLTIWRLPGGGFAVGRFSGGRRVGGGGGERDLPVVYTELDGGFNNRGRPRRVSWASRENASRESGNGGRRGGGLRRVFRNLFSCFGGMGSSSASSSSSGSRLSQRSSSSQSSVFSTSFRRRRDFAFNTSSGRRRW